jgi:hypothetical protein
MDVGNPDYPEQYETIPAGEPRIAVEPLHGWSVAGGLHCYESLSK